MLNWKRTLFGRFLPKEKTDSDLERGATTNHVAIPVTSPEEEERLDEQGELEHKTPRVLREGSSDFRWTPILFKHTGDLIHIIHRFDQSPLETATVDARAPYECYVEDGSRMTTLFREKYNFTFHPCSSDKLIAFLHGEQLDEDEEDGEDEDEDDYEEPSHVEPPIDMSLPTTTTTTTHPVVNGVKKRSKGKRGEGSELKPTFVVKDGADKCELSPGIRLRQVPINFVALYYDLTMPRLDPSFSCATATSIAPSSSMFMELANVSREIHKAETTVIRARQSLEDATRVIEAERGKMATMIDKMANVTPPPSTVVK